MNLSQPLARLAACTASLLMLTAHLATASMITGVISDKPYPVLFPKNSIRMEVAFDREFTKFKTEATNFDVTIHAKFTNITSQPVQLLLKEHDTYHRALDYPWGIEVRITNNKGIVLTDNTTTRDGWWSSSYYCSQFSQLIPGDIITLKKGETITREFPLQKVLLNLREKTSSVSNSGDFIIEVRFGTIPAQKPLSLKLN